MTALEKQHGFRRTPTPCPRCEKRAGRATGNGPWLNELTITDATRSVHAVLCQRPGCGFAEIRSLAGDAFAVRVQPSRWLRLREAAKRYPRTLAIAAVVFGSMLGLILGLTATW
jgi:hypothetical protein